MLSGTAVAGGVGPGTAAARSAGSPLVVAGSQPAAGGSPPASECSPPAFAGAAVGSVAFVVVVLPAIQNSPY